MTRRPYSMQALLHPQDQPTVQQWWPQPPDVHPTTALFAGRSVRWFNDSDLPSVEIDVRYVAPEPNNIMDAEKLTAFYRAMKAAYAQGADPPTFRMPLATVHLIDAGDVAESQEAERAGRLHELGLDQPWTTGDEDLDAYLADPDEFADDRWDEFVVEGREDEADARLALSAEMDAAVQEAVAGNAGDLGRRAARLSDGHHRAFAAILAGEPTIWVRASQYSMDGLRRVQPVVGTTGSSPIQRHRTALKRKSLSRPMRLAIDDGVITRDTEVLDYGCGRGDDVRRLRRKGIDARGYDPHYAPAGDRSLADVVNLGYVANVIEDPAERDRVLRRAWKAARKVLVVSARLQSERKGRGQRYGDGCRTSQGTFQKFFSQESLRRWIEQTLGAKAIPAAPGVFYVVRDPQVAQKLAAATTAGWTRTVGGAQGVYPYSNREQMILLLRKAARYTIAAAQDENAMIRMLHANYGAGFLFALEALFTHEEIRRETGLDLREIHRLVLEEQDKAQRIMAAECPTLVPSGKLAEMGRELLEEQALSVAGPRNGRVAGLGLRRAVPVGKRMGKRVYVHRDYADQVVPRQQLLDAQRTVEAAYPDHRWVVVRYEPATGVIALVDSPDFDEEDEPVVGDMVVVEGGGRVRYRSAPADPEVWHHKWMFVPDDYPGFDVKRSKQRSAQWEPYVSKDERRRIGRKSVWDQMRSRWEGSPRQVGARLPQLPVHSTVADPVRLLKGYRYRPRNPQIRRIPYSTEEIYYLLHQYLSPQVTAVAGLVALRLLRERRELQEPELAAIDDLERFVARQSTLQPLADRFEEMLHRRLAVPRRSGPPEPAVQWDAIAVYNVAVAFLIANPTSWRLPPFLAGREWWRYPVPGANEEGSGVWHRVQDIAGRVAQFVAMGVQDCAWALGARWEAAALDFYIDWWNEFRWAFPVARAQGLEVQTVQGRRERRDPFPPGGDGYFLWEELLRHINNGRVAPTEKDVRLYVSQEYAAQPSALHYTAVDEVVEELLRRGIITRRRR